MYNKIHYISLVLFGLIFFMVAGEVFADASSDIEQAKQNIISLIKEGDYAQAKAQTQKLIEDYSTNSALPDALYLIARQYEWSSKCADAKTVYEQMIQNSSASSHIRLAELGVSRTDILILIQSGKYDEAQKKYTELREDFFGHSGLPDTLFWIAKTYDFEGKHNYAKDTFRRIIEDNPDDYWTERAKVGYARANILSLVSTRKYYDAKNALKLNAEKFSDHPDWPSNLYWIAEGYRWAGRFKDAKDLYNQIIENYSDSSYIIKARLGISMAEVESKIGSDDLLGSKKSIDKLMDDFKNHPDLADTLYWIARSYRWSNQFEEEKNIYQMILEKYPDNKYASEAKLGIARANVQLLIEAKDYENAQEAYANLITKFNEHPDLEDTLYAIARQYGEAGIYEEERSVYQLIIQKYPASQHRSKAEAGISSGSNILSLATSKDSNGTEEILDEVTADSNENPNLAKTLLFTGEKCNEEAFRYIDKGLYAEAKEYFKKAVSAWERIIVEVPPSIEYTPAAYHLIAYNCFERLGEHEKAIECCKKVVDDWPNYQNVADVQFLIGNYYERLAYSGIMPETTANSKMEKAYQAVIEKYPNSDHFKYASLKLAELNFKKGQWTDAAACFELLLQKYPEDQRPGSIVYQLGRAYEEMGELDLAAQLYKEFMETAFPTDPLIEDVKARLKKFNTVGAREILTEAEMSGIHGGHHGPCKWYSSIACYPIETPCHCSDEGPEDCYGECFTGCNASSWGCFPGNQHPSICHEVHYNCRNRVTGTRWTCVWDDIYEYCSYTWIDENCYDYYTDCYYEGH